MNEEVLSTSRIEQRLLTELPEWHSCEGNSIQRCYVTSGWKSSLMIVNAVGYLAETAWHHPRIELEYSVVKVNLTTHSAGGVTEKDLELAKKIDELVLWQPQGSALHAPPDKFSLLNKT